MWIYEKKLQKPVKIANSDPAMAQIIITQLGGPDGETGAAMRYLSQRYAMPNNKVNALSAVSQSHNIIILFHVLLVVLIMLKTLLAFVMSIIQWFIMMRRLQKHYLMPRLV